MRHVMSAAQKPLQSAFANTAADSIAMLALRHIRRQANDRPSLLTPLLYPGLVSMQVKGW